MIDKQIYWYCEETETMIPVHDLDVNTSLHEKDGVVNLVNGTIIRQPEQMMVYECRIIIKAQYRDVSKAKERFAENVDPELYNYPDGDYLRFSVDATHLWIERQDQTLVRLYPNG